MKKIALISILLFCGITAFTQGFYFPTSVTVKGEHKQRVKVDSTFLGPTGCGYPSLNGSTAYGMFAIYYDTCGHHFYIYDPSTAIWDSLTRGATISTAVTVFDSISQIDAYVSPSTVAIIVNDTARGGTFLKYSGSYPVDSGMIFEDGLAQKWIRQTVDNAVNVQWYGAKASNTGSTNRDKFILARDFIYNNYRYGTLFIPADTTGGTGYYLSDSISFNKPIIIEGEGEMGFPKSKLIFPLDKNGIVIDYAYPQNGFSTEIKNIYLSTGLGGSGPYNINAHAIKTTLQINIYNVWAYAWGGNGLHISACAIPTTGENNNYGNASNSVIHYFKANYCTNGIFIEGCDANTIELRDIDMSQNRRWGVFDNGMLGNLYLKPHFAFNGVPAINGANSVVEYSGKYYSAKPGFDGYWSDAADSNYNKLPTNSTYWYEVPFMTSTVWNDSTRYYSGGPLCIRNANAWSNIINSYTEAFQPPIYLNPRSKVDGGDNGADVEGGIWHNIYSGIEYIRNGDVSIWGDTLRQSRFSIGADIDAIAPLVVVNDGDLTGTLPVAQFEIKNRGGLLMNFKNMWSLGQIGYNVYDFNFYPNAVLSTQITTTGVHPGSDSAYDLGSISQRWKRVYGTKFYGDMRTATNLPQTLNFNHNINANSNEIFFDNVSQFGVIGGFIDLSTTGQLNELHITDDSLLFKKRASYSSNVHSTFTQHSLIDRDYLDSMLTTVSGSLAIGSTIASATAGSIFFGGTGGTFQQKNDKLFYDSTNARLGIGVNTPDSTLHVVGSGHFTTNVAIDGKLTVAGAIDPTHLYLDEQSGNPGGISNKGVLYTKDVSTNTELFYQSSNGTVTQLSPASTSADSSIFYTVYRADTSRTNIYSAINGKQAAGSYSVTTNNLSDLSNATTARNNILPSKTGNGLKVLRVNAGETDYELATVGGSGTVTDVSVVTANGFAGSVATSTTTPAITISTSITGLLKGNGTAISAASSGTDYAPATSGSGILKGNGSGGFSSAGETTVGNNMLTLTNPGAITFPRFNADNTVDALNASSFRTAIGAGTGDGTVTAIGVTTANGVSGSSSGGATPNLTITLGAITPSSVNGVVVSGSATPTLSVTGTSSISGSNTGDQIISDATITTTDITTNNFTIAKHGFVPKGTNVGNFLKDDGTWAAPSGGVSDGDKGDITVSGSGATWTIDNSAVSLGKIANIADLTILGNNTGIAAAPVALSAAQTKTVLSLNNVENTALSTWAGTTNITTLGTIGTGTWQGSTINYAYLGSGGGGATKFLREDNTWQTVSGSGDMILASVQSVTGLKTFDKDKIATKGTSTGVTTISTANTSGTDYTFTLPAVNVTAAQLTYLTTASSAATASTLMLRDANANVSVNNIVDAYTSTATAAGTTTLTVSSDFYQDFSGSSTQTVVLPDATTLTNGHQFFIMDNSTGNLTVNMNGGSLLKTVPANQYIIVTLTNNGTAAGTWTVQSSVPKDEFIRQSATYTLTSTTNIQKLFNASTNGALTVKGSTTYIFEGVININTMSATSGNMKFDVLGAGTATLTSAGWSAIGLDNTTIGTAATHGGSYTATNVSSGNITTAATGTAVYARIKGIITVNAGGTIIPSVGLTTANAAVVGVNTWMRFTEILPSGTNYTPGWN